MATVPKRVTERLVAGIKRYQPVLANAKSRDIGEADTVTIVKDLLADVFGYDNIQNLPLNIRFGAHSAILPSSSTAFCKPLLR